MRLMREMLAAVFGGLKVPLERGAMTEAEEAAWSDYHSTWEMDPPPEPRAVFLAGYRAGKDREQ
ncbi:hypothetical protein J2X20_003883 [Pelomonas saccharophila]|uniref:Uncharacterized protein n=1 Tax=Roseateles saccharophilus TaxID=304 RepID=A0ABU1YQS6_ROSSA|nr:hypothetical protein [Roseateles saccharophilus]MDR7271215.1 hypothetical protein [Roseateles saccharophilus]